MGKISRFLKSQDIFGHHVELNFNRKGSTHNTVLGGCASILVKAAMLFYTAILFQKVVFHLEDDISTVTLN